MADNESSLPLHKLYAMGRKIPEDKIDTSDGWPATGNGKAISTGRGVGRGPDIKKSGMPKCDPEVQPFWAGAKEPEGMSERGTDFVAVSAHKRAKPARG